MGAAKASLEWHGSTLLRRIAGLVERSVGGPVVVVRSAGQSLPELPADFEVVDDAHAGRGPLEGLAAGLRALDGRAEMAYVSSTDVPFLHTSFVGAVVGGIGAEHEICVPEVGRRWQPLAAVYRTSVTGVVDELLAGGERRIGALFDRCRVRRLDREDLLGDAGVAEGDPGLESVVNLNDRAAYESARGRAAPVIAVTFRGGPVGGRTDGEARAATLGRLAGAVGVVLGEGVGVELNRRRTRPDGELPLERGDAVVFETRA
jgi:molybdopterin-guanine dinucleotide biosynthesis protein A